MKSFQIEYNANWHRPKKPMFKTEVEANDETEAREIFKRYYPAACLETIKLIK